MKKTNMNRMAAVAAAVMMAAVGYVAGKANTPTTIIEPATIVVAHAAAAEVEEVEEQVEPEIIEEQVEEEKEEFVKIEKILDSNGNLREFRVYTKGAYDNVMNSISYKYLPEAVEYINEYTATRATYYERNGKFVIIDVISNKEIDADVFKAVE